MKTGILGGTFNPIHNAHLALGKAAKEQFALDRMFFMPTSKPAYKPDEDIVSFEHRYNMVNLAVNEVLGGAAKGYFTSDFEAQREGNTYTYETLTLLKQQNPEDELYFVIGADSLLYFDKWRNPEIIAKLCVLLVAERGNNEASAVEEKASEIRKLYNADIRFIDYKPNFVSSTDCRKEIEIGRLWTTDLPGSVQKYIFDKDLYKRARATFTYTPEAINETMRKMEGILSSYRYQHSVGVAYMSASLAMVYGVPTDKAIMAGLLHDCAKEIPKDEQERLCDEYGVPLRDVERSIKQLIHGRLGAYLAKTQYEITDEDVINAISNHTVGRPNMTRLEQIIFCADFLEPQRDYYSEPSLDYLRELIFKDIDKATYLIIENQLNFFKAKKREVDPQTADTGAYYSKIVNERGI